MTKTSKITEIIGVKERKGDKGTVYYFTVKMENGDQYPIKKGKMKNDGYQLGQELVYTVEKDGEYDKIFVQEPAFEKKGYTPAPKDYAKDFISFAMSYAKDVMVARPEMKLADMIILYKEIYKEMAEKLI